MYLATCSAQGARYAIIVLTWEADPAARDVPFMGVPGAPEGRVLAESELPPPLVAYIAGTKLRCARYRVAELLAYVAAILELDAECRNDVDIPLPINVPVGERN